VTRRSSRRALCRLALRAPRLVSTSLLGIPREENVAAAEIELTTVDLSALEATFVSQAIPGES